MIKEQKEKRTVEQEIVVSVTCTCDVCKKKIYEKRYNDQRILSGKYERTQFYKVSTGHNDWGNDSVDSIENYTICSPECLDSIMKEYYYRSFESGFTNTEWINIDHDYTADFVGG